MITIRRGAEIARVDRLFEVRVLGGSITVEGRRYEDPDEGDAIYEFEYDGHTWSVGYEEVNDDRKPS